MNYDNERVDRIFTMFCCGIAIAFFLGVITGTLITYFLPKLL